MGLVGLGLAAGLATQMKVADAQSRPVAPLRTAAQLAVEGRAVCQQARTRRKPLLVTFGADWCPDCRDMVFLSQVEPLASALRRYEQIDINVGRFDRHTELTDAWAIRAISAWVVVTPSACDRPMVDWPRVTQRTLEPSTGAAVDPSELASWLVRNLTAAAAPSAP